MNKKTDRSQTIIPIEDVGSRGAKRSSEKAQKFYRAVMNLEPGQAIRVPDVFDRAKSTLTGANQFAIAGVFGMKCSPDGVYLYRKDANPRCRITGKAGKG